jgi:hypothetical protein
MCGFRPPRKDHQGRRVQANRRAEECPHRAPCSAHISPKRLPGVCASVHVCAKMTKCILISDQSSCPPPVFLYASPLHSRPVSLYPYLCLSPSLPLFIAPSCPLSLSSPPCIDCPPSFAIHRITILVFTHDPSASFLPGGRDDWPRVFCHGAQGQACCLWQECRAQGDSFATPARNLSAFLFVRPAVPPSAALRLRTPVRPCCVPVSSAPALFCQSCTVAFSPSSACSLFFPYALVHSPPAPLPFLGIRRREQRPLLLFPATRNPCTP